MTKEGLIPELPEQAFMIIQGSPIENFCAEEKEVADELGIIEVNFDIGSGVYINLEDTKAVAIELTRRKPSRQLSVIVGKMEKRRQ